MKPSLLSLLSLLLLTLPPSASSINYNPDGTTIPTSTLPPNADFNWLNTKKYASFSVTREDTVTFKFAAPHSVANVPTTDYDSCPPTSVLTPFRVAEHPTGTVVWSASDVAPSPAPVEVKFVCMAHCNVGQKVTIEVIPPATLTPTSSPTPTTASPSASPTPPPQVGPSASPVKAPTLHPTQNPTHAPTTQSPTSLAPTESPTPASVSGSTFRLNRVVFGDGSFFELRSVTTNLETTITKESVRVECCLYYPGQAWIAMGLESNLSSGSRMVGGRAVIGMDPATNPGHPAVGLYSLDGNSDPSDIHLITENTGLLNATFLSHPDNTTMCFVLDQAISSSIFTLYDPTGSGVFSSDGLLGRRRRASSSSSTLTGMIFSHGADPVFQQHSQFTVQRLDFSPLTGNETNNNGTTGQAEYIALSSTILAHIVFMLLSATFFLPIGVSFPVLRSHRCLVGSNPQLWFQLHRGVQTFGFVLMTIGFALAVSYKSDGDGFGKPFTQVHHQLGLATYILFFVQVVNGYLRPHKEKDGAAPSRARRGWFFGHRLVALTAITMGFANEIEGVYLLEQFYVNLVGPDVVDSIRDAVYVFVSFACLGVAVLLGISASRTMMSSAATRASPPPPTTHASLPTAKTLPMETNDDKKDGVGSDFRALPQASNSSGDVGEAQVAVV